MQVLWFSASNPLRSPVGQPSSPEKPENSESGLEPLPLNNYPPLQEPFLPPQDFFSPQKSVNLSILDWDDSEIITGGELRGPTEKTPVFLDNQGNLYKKDLENDSDLYTGQPSFILLGQVKTDGLFRLLTGQQGSIFSSPILRLSVGEARTPYGEGLRQADRDRALKNSEIPWIRKNLTNLGFDGRGVTIAVIEPDVNEDKPMRSHLHTFSVASVATDSKYGVAPGAKVKCFDAGDGGTNLISTQPSVWNEKVIPPLQDNVADLNQRIAETVVYGYQNISNRLLKILDWQDPSLRVINMSMSGNRLDLYLNLADVLKEKDKKKAYKYPQLRAVILGPEATAEDYELTDGDVMQSCIRYVDYVMQYHPAIKKAALDYQSSTRKIVENGIILVVSASNNHDRLPYELETKPGWDYNEFAMSPYVISVAASDTQGTPGNQRDDTIAPFSSSGDMRLWNPTIAAPGSGIPVPKWTAPNGVQYGTSFAAPYVSGTIAMMLQKNPNLNFSDIKGILQKTAVRVSIPYWLAGSGMINPVQAVKATPTTTATTSLWPRFNPTMPALPAEPFHARFFTDTASSLAKARKKQPGGLQSHGMDAS